MKKLFAISVLILSSSLVQSLAAQTCNDPNAHNTGDPLPCATCFDGILNGDEIEVDCGGTNPSCPPCDFQNRLEVVGDGKVFGDLEVHRNIGIGISSPDAKLSIQDNGAHFSVRPESNANGTLLTSSQSLHLVFDDNSMGTDFFSIRKGGTTIGSSTSLFRIFDNGNVGIGVNNPSERLHVLGTVLIEGNPLIRTSTGAVMHIGGNQNGDIARLGLLEDTDAGQETGIRLEYSGTNDELNFVEMVGGNRTFNLLTIERSREVGISTTTPDYTLEVNGDAGKPGSSLWIVSSDRRLKQEIEDYEDGLEEILQIHPVWYRYNGKYQLPTDKRFVGVIAQEIQKIAPYTVSSYTAEDEETGSQGEYLNYDGTAIIYMLVNATQEQQELIKAQQTEIEELKKMVYSLMEEKTSAPLTDHSAVQLSDSKLYPNRPNPFSETTVIRYFIPDRTTDAKLQIADMSGKIVKSIPIINKGEGQITLQANTLSSGTYFYSLIVDSELITTEKMVLTSSK